MLINKGPMTPEQEEQEILRTRKPQKGEILGIVLEMLGAGKLRVVCEDENTRICRIAGKIRKRMWVKPEDLVLIKPWVVQENERGDVVWRYTRTQALYLKKCGYLKKLDF